MQGYNAQAVVGDGQTEIALIERGIAEHALGSQAIKRLMTVPE